METEVWSREIDKKNRITYSIDDEKVIVEVLTALGHYDVGKRKIVGVGIYLTPFLCLIKRSLFETLKST